MRPIRIDAVMSAREPNVCIAGEQAGAATGD